MYSSHPDNDSFVTLAMLSTYTILLSRPTSLQIQEELIVLLGFKQLTATSPEQRGSNTYGNTCARAIDEHLQSIFVVESACSVLCELLLQTLTCTSMCCYFLRGCDTSAKAEHMRQAETASCPYHLRCLLPHNLDGCTRCLESGPYRCHIGLTYLSAAG